MRRVWLVTRRIGERAFKSQWQAPDARRGPMPPQPLFAPRQIATRTEAGWLFRFLGGEARMGEALRWQPADHPGAAQLWLMNLHYMEYLEALADNDVEALILQWIAENSPHREGALTAAWNAYALSLRAVVWMQQLASRSGFGEDLRERAERSLVEQLLYLESHLETDIDGNHLIKNIKALLWASAYFQGPTASRWRRKGLVLLARALPRQILPDGMHFELSPAYHCQVFADLVEIRHALAEDPLDGSLDDALIRASRVLAELCHPDGNIAQFSDSGLNMAYAPHECMSAYASIGGIPPAPSPLFLFPDGGYFGVRQEESYAVVDAGMVAPPGLPAHGHGDIFSFEWSLDGERIIVDQGVYEYVAGERRTASRTTRSHNTLHIEGGDQAEFFGAFRCGRMAKSSVQTREIDGGGLVLVGSHDGYRMLPGAPVHHRRFDLYPRKIRISDRIEGLLTREARIALLLHPRVRARRISAGQWRLSCGKAVAEINGSCDIHAEEAVWWPDMGVEMSTVRLVVTLIPGMNDAVLELVGLGPIQEIDS
ncbi:MAG: heparinase II/III family protein [Sphingosinicella sp.]|uniref:heparinase II/III family protein n=1 Tax=Sphingosinicella sp. TaxID=1917971 RepID=UPI004037F19F